MIFLEIPLTDIIGSLSNYQNSNEH